MSSNGFRIALGSDKSGEPCAVVVDGREIIRCFLVSLAHLEKIAGGSAEGMRYWQMTDKCLSGYRADPLIKGFELQTAVCSWRDS